MNDKYDLPPPADSPQLTNAQALEIKMLLLIKEAIDYNTQLTDILVAIQKCEKHTQAILDELWEMEDANSKASD